MTELINTLTERMEQYMKDITDCCGDECLFAELKGRIDELKYILDLLIDEEARRIDLTTKKDV